MDAHLVEATIKAYLTEIRNRLDKAAGIGRAADDAPVQAFMRRVLKSLSTSNSSSTRQQRW
jgi:hypothetical protein